MLTVETLVWAFIIFICAYAIVNRICKCLEYRAMAKSFGQACGSGAEFSQAVEDWKHEQKSRNQAGSQTGTERSDGHV